MSEIAELVRRHGGRGAGHGHLLRHAAHRAGRHLRGGGVHQHRLPARRRARAARARRGDPRCPRRRDHARRRVHPRRGRVPGRLRPDAVRAGQPPLRRRRRRPRASTAGRRPPGRPPGRHRPAATAPWCGCAARSACRPTAPPSRPSGPPWPQEQAAGPPPRPPTGRRRPDGHHRRPQDRHVAPRLRRLPHPGALPGHRRLRRAAQGADHDARGGGGRGRRGQPARPGRRRLPGRAQVVDAAQGPGDLPGDQRRRERAGHLQGPPAHRGRPAPDHRGRADLRLRPAGHARPSSTCGASSPSASSGCRRR